MLIFLVLLILLVLVFGAPIVGIPLLVLLIMLVWIGFEVADFLAWLGWGGGILFLLAIIAVAWADVNFGWSKPPKKPRRLTPQQEENLRRWREERDR